MASLAVFFLSSGIVLALIQVPEWSPTVLDKAIATLTAMDAHGLAVSTCRKPSEFTKGCSESGQTARPQLDPIDP